jgi:hypothetical protein
MTSIKKIKINDVRVKPIHTTTTQDKRPARASTMFEVPYSTVFICAPKNSGKTTTLYEIMRRKVMPFTHVIIFCGTSDVDDSYKRFREFCEAKDVPCDFFHSTKNENKESILGMIRENLEKTYMGEGEDDEDGEEEEPEDRVPLIGLDEMPTPDFVDALTEKEEDEEEKEPTFEELQEEYKARSKYRELDYLFIFDDLAGELRDENISKFIKRHRHFKSMCLFSSQWIHDLKPDTIRQAEYFILFKGNNPDKLKKIFMSIDLGMPFEQFLSIYKDATAEPFSFLYVDVPNKQLRQNFDTLIKYKVEPIKKKRK